MNAKLKELIRKSYCGGCRQENHCQKDGYQCPLIDNIMRDESPDDIDVADVVHAKWEHHYIDGFYCCTCSACLREIPVQVTGKTPYCPWCGAKMDKDGDKQ